jgi:hypothetical protein
LVYQDTYVKTFCAIRDNSGWNYVDQYRLDQFVRHVRRIGVCVMYIFCLHARVWGLVYVHVRLQKKGQAAVKAAVFGSAMRKGVLAGCLSLGYWRSDSIVTIVPPARWQSQCRELVIRYQWSEPAIPAMAPATTRYLLAVAVDCTVQGTQLLFLNV